MNEIIEDGNNKLHKETDEVCENAILHQLDMRNMFDMNTERTRKRYDQMQKRKAFLNNINYNNNNENNSNNKLTQDNSTQFVQTAQTTPSPLNDVNKLSNCNQHNEKNEPEQMQSNNNDEINDNKENVELNISNLDNSVEIHEDVDDTTMNNNNNNGVDLKQIISKYHAKSKSFIQLNNNLVARAAVDNKKNTQSYMMALCPELFNNSINRISVNYDVELDDIIKEENELENNNYNSNNNNNTNVQLNTTTQKDSSNNNTKSNYSFTINNNKNNNNKINKKKHRRTASAIIPTDPVVKVLHKNPETRSKYSKMKNLSGIYDNKQLSISTNNITKRQKRKNYSQHITNIYKDKEYNSMLSLSVSDRKTISLKNQKSNSTKIIFDKPMKYKSIEKISFKPLNNSIVTLPYKNNSANKYVNNPKINSYRSKEQIFTNLKKKYPNYTFTFTSPNFKNTYKYCISPHSTKSKHHYNLNNTSKINAKLNLSQKINSIPFFSSSSSKNIQNNNPLSYSVNANPSKKLIITALQRINFHPLSAYSSALNALHKSQKDMFCILVCNDNKNGEFLFRGLYEINKNEQGECVNAVKLYSYSYSVGKIMFKQVKHFYTIRINYKKIYEFYKYKPKLKEFDDKVVLIM
jgi:hypothetical protein